MKLQPDRIEGVNAIQSALPDQIVVNGQPWTRSVLIPWQGDVCAWDGALPGQVVAEHFDAVMRWAPEVVLFGTGRRLRFAPPVVLRGLYERQIGIETMDTVAACRTYNILVGEGRRVVAALLLG